MTIQEFSNEFDTIIDSYAYKSQFGDNYATAFNEYEKSVFLTRAQRDIVLSYYNGKNAYQEGFEKTEEVRRYLQSLVQTVGLTKLDTPTNLLQSTHIQFELPTDLEFIVYEQLSAIKNKGTSCEKTIILQIQPITHDEYIRISANPFRNEESMIRALRLDCGDNKVELVYNTSLTPDKYTIRYIGKLSPIILEDLTNTDLSIDGINTVSECKLSPILHREILEQAVRLALSSKVWEGKSNSKQNNNE